MKAQTQEARSVEDHMLAVCREVDPQSGTIAVYPLDCKVTNDIIFCLSIRARVNPELRYFVVLRETWDSEESRENLTKRLKRRDISPSTVEAWGGIKEL